MDLVREQRRHPHLRHLHLLLPYVTGQPCPTASASTDTGLIQWSVNNLTGARSVYTYDPANRLTGATNYGGHSYGYTYDVNGNRTTQVTDGVTTQSLTFDTASNEITSAGGWIYDGAGNLTHHPTFANLAYNQAGQMVSAGTATYTYAGPDQAELTHQDLNVTGQTYDYVYSRPTPQGVPTLDSVTKGGTTTTYITNDPVTGAPQGMTLSTGQNDYFATDGQGSVVGLISGTSGGTVLATYTYDPYGVITATTGSGTAFATNPYFHAGGLGDPKTSWNRHGVRYNDNTTGRWTTTDPITRLANPDPYTNDNPVNHADFTGRDGDQAIAAAICGVAGTAFGFIGVLPGLVIGIGCTIIGVGDALTS
ncbi:MAG: RHS repeat-associated core domain-containing protein [Lapillicoccus sp.]